MMFNKRLGLMALGVAIASVSVVRSAWSLNVFGLDDRVEKAYDSSHRKIVYVGNGCTGALVWKNLVLTAAHCLRSFVQFSEEGHSFFSENPSVYTQRRGSSYAFRAKGVQAWWGTLDSRHEPAKDWAILRIDANLGEAEGYFAFADDRMPGLVFLDGFNSDLNSGGPRLTGPKNGCRIREYRTSLVVHDCNMTRGASGAPIWKQVDGGEVIVALNVGENRNGGEDSLFLREGDWSTHPNYAVPVGAFAGKLAELRRRFPDGEAR